MRDLTPSHAGPADPFFVSEALWTHTVSREPFLQLSCLRPVVVLRYEGWPAKSPLPVLEIRNWVERDLGETGVPAAGQP